MERYGVLERIAHGGMGVTYRGEDQRLHRPVCIKAFLGLDPQRPEYRTILEHFVQEAFTLSRLRHPNTLRIYDYGQLTDGEDPTPYFVTEYADGGTLKEHVDRAGALHHDEVLEVLEPIVGALREAHDCGILHRDIKPSNILFTFAGAGRVVKLADFSVAKSTSEMPGRAEDTAAAGAGAVPLYSLSWAAPEQLTDVPVGPPTDVFGLGLTTTFMLTAQMLYPGTNVMHLYALRRRGEAYRREFFEKCGLGREMCDFLTEATRENPEQRLQSAEAFLEAFDHTLDRLEATQRRQTSPGMAPVRPVQHAPAAPPMAPRTASRPTLRLDSLERQLVAGGRRIRPVALGPELVLARPESRDVARLRVTPSDVNGGERAHIKGLNCYVAPAGGRPSSGMDVWGTTSLVLTAPDGRRLLEIRVVLGSHQGADRKFELSDAVLEIPIDPSTWLMAVEAGPGGDVVVLHRGRERS